jgi:hypothetical protein
VTSAKPPPPLCPLGNESPEFAFLLERFEFLASSLGQKDAQRLWRDAARRPRHRPPGSTPEQDKARLVQQELTEALLSCDRLMPYLPVAFQLRKSFEFVAFTLGQEAARALWTAVAKRPRGRPRGPSNPEQDEALLHLAGAFINGSNPVPLGQLAKFIYDENLLGFDLTARAIEMKLRRLKRESQKVTTVLKRN